MEQVVREIDIFTPVVGDSKNATLERKEKMEDDVIVGNMGHFDNEFGMKELEDLVRCADCAGNSSLMQRNLPRTVA